MKKIVAILFLSNLCAFYAFAQVQVVSKPAPGYEQRIRDYVNNMRIVDTHEHLQNPSNYKNSGMKDFTLLFHHYSEADIRSGGMPKELVRKILKDSLTVIQKWNIFKPYWENTANTAYNRAVMLTIQKLFGINELNDKTVEDLSNKIKNAYQSPDNWYLEVLKDKCKIDYIVYDAKSINYGDPAMNRVARRFDDYIGINSWRSIKQLCERKNIAVETLDDYLKSFKMEFDEAVKGGIVAVKTALAYQRPLFYENVSKEQAEAVFSRLKAAGSDITFKFEEVKPLQDFVMHQVIKAAGGANIPVQIHTGLQTGDGNDITMANPALLSNLFLQYRNVKFLLMHGGYPYGGEYGTIAKCFANVYLDLCWLHIISPSYSERYLNEWLETVPVSKIMGFGGDFHNPEGTYGHQLFARQIVANVLIKKVQDGYFSEKEAIRYAQMILHDNAIKIMQLDKKP